MPNRWGPLALLVLISGINAVGQLMMRWGGMQSAGSPLVSPSIGGWLWSSRWWLAGILVGWVAGLGWAWCLRRLPLGIAIPIYAGLAYVFSIAGGFYLLKERLTPMQWLGALTILVGVLFIGLSRAPLPMTQPHK